MLYVIIIAAVIAVLVLSKKTDAGGGNTGGGDAGGGSGTQGKITLPIGTYLYQEKDGTLSLWAELGSPITITPLLDATRPDYKYFNWTERLLPPFRK